ncbi:MAG: hypothetical protein WCA15_06635 [Candidatus Acidiferrales bacterium]
MAKKKTARKIKKKSAKKSAPKKKLALKTKKKPPAKKKPARRKKATRRRPADEISNPISARNSRGLGPDSGGQSGDVQGLSGREVADSESVEELAEEGQDYEAGIVSGVENAPDADQGEVRTREVPENDVPEEYLDEQ